MTAGRNRGGEQGDVVVCHDNVADVENHPFEPFLPANARLLMLGSFPPSERRWSMRFYYPNFTNDMWRIFGIVFFDDKDHFIDEANKTYRLDDIVDFLKEKGIALYDTATKVKRLKNTASDKDLEVVEATDIGSLLTRLPACNSIVTTGQKATDVLCQWIGLTEGPKVGSYVAFNWKDRPMRLYRMPSSSRAYPMNVYKKADAYRLMFQEIMG